MTSDTPAPVTPAFITSHLSAQRLAELAALFDLPVPALHAHPEPRKAAIRMLALLNEPELRGLATTLNVDVSGDFMVLFRRLTALC